jgi:two-component system sensor histidine kinase BaeS
MGSGGGDGRSAGRSLVESMVHDLKNPLSALAGNLALLREELGETEPSPVAGRCLGDAVALCDRVLRMVQSLADVDAAERGTMRIHPEPVRLRALVDAAVRLVEVDAGTREQTVDVEVGEDVEAEVDGRLLGQVIQNLIDNGVRYAPRRGRVVIRAAVGDGALTLAVGNSGPALTAAERAAVFEPDFRIAERAAGARRGRDFGLYFGRIVVEAHGGSLTCEQDVGLPAMFVVRIPLRPGRPAAP